MSAAALRDFIRAEITDAKAKGVLFSVHLKATMMKISDPVIFGHFVSVYLEGVFKKFGDTLAGLGVNPDSGIGDMISKLDGLPPSDKAAIMAEIDAALVAQPPLYMVD